MFQINLTDERAEILREMLVSHLSDLRMEIAYAQQKEFREFLKSRGNLLENFLKDLEKELTAKGRKIISIDRLRHVDIFQELTDWELQIVSQFVQEENLAEGSILTEEGEEADRLFILEQGAVALRARGGEQYNITTPWKIVGWSFLVPPRRYTATATTIAPSKLLMIKSPDFHYLIHKEPKMGIKVMANLAQVVASRLPQLKSRS